MEYKILKKEKVACYHCGDTVIESHFQVDDRDFCCLGCQTVYQILGSNNLHQYYKYNQHPGKTNKKPSEDLSYLNDTDITAKLVDFRDDVVTHITFYIPVIHCSSCVWLLENLYRFDPAIQKTQTDFLKKQLTVVFKHNGFSLRQLVELLVSLGYGPKITLQDVIRESEDKRLDQSILVRKITVAGFCFGNSMMLSFPEYFGLASFELQYALFFGYFNLLLTIPVMSYSALDYFKSSYYSLRNKQLNLDVPLALGILMLFLRTAVDVISQTGAGFADTLCSLVFFLLIGRFVQQKTYYHISFERDYRSYFPVAVTKLSEGKEEATQLADLKVGDRIFIRNNEIIPADATLINGNASLDFSFVTGESELVKKVNGEIVYAGARQMSAGIELEIVKPVSQSYLTTLWNNKEHNTSRQPFKSFSNTVSQYFTPALLLVALSALSFWWIQGDIARGWNAFTATLIIACPCALALTSPFTMSTVLSVFDKNKFFVKNAIAVEKMAKIDTFVFDKTGTISLPKTSEMRFEGYLKQEQAAHISGICRNSNHPLSRKIVQWIGRTERMSLTNYKEIIGKGMIGTVNGLHYKIGSSKHVGVEGINKEDGGSRVHVALNGRELGYFIIDQPWREGLSNMIRSFTKSYNLHLLSGDNDKEKEDLQIIFPSSSHLLFSQLPHQKLEFIRNLQDKTYSVCMVGDGLNDSAALRQADLGIAVSDDINNFSPGCDAILDGQSFDRLPSFFKFSKDTILVIHRSFILSVVYNIVGLSFAIQGTMSPLVAAVIMPLSTLTIISFTTLSARYFARRNNLIL